MKLKPRTDKKPDLGNLKVLFEGKVERRKVSELSLSEGSPRVYSQEGIVRAAAACREIGIWLPLLVNKRGKVLAGEPCISLPGASAYLKCQCLSPGI